MNKTVLFHGNCPDGAAAAWAAWLVLADQAQYIPVNYGQPIPDIPDESELYVLDFSYPPAALIELFTRMKLVVVLDHHATAQKDLAGVHPLLPSLVRFDMARSGAVLAWEYFHPDEPLPEILSFVQDRDLWEWKLPKSREVSAALQMRGWTNETFSAIRDGGAQAIATLAGEGDLLLRFKNQQVEIMAKNHRYGIFDTENKTIDFEQDFEKAAMRVQGTEIGRYVVPVSNATVFFSEVGEKLLELYPHAKFAAYYLDRSDGKRQWGIRARKDFDAATLIAKPFGGGGHAQACGMVTDL